MRPVFGELPPALPRLSTAQRDRLMALAGGEVYRTRDVTFDALARRALARWDAETRCQVVTDYGADIAKSPLHK